MSFLHFLVVSFRDFIFPPICLGCDEHEVYPTNSEFRTQKTERRSFRSVLHSLFSVRGSAFAGSPGLVCKSCLEALERNPLPARPKGKSDITHVRALGLYVPPFSTLVHELKYRNHRSLAEVLGKALAGLLLSDGALKQADVLVPVPLHPARRRERGYNQSELLAQVVSRLTRIPKVNALKRVRNTRSQVTLDDEARRKNLAGAFAMRLPDVQGKRVILVDDVSTTRATLDTAASVLKGAGAEVVYALVVARAGDKPKRTTSVHKTGESRNQKTNGDESRNQRTNADESRNQRTEN